jgi:hypothetical protein
LFYQNVTGAYFGGKNYHHYKYLSTVNVCEGTEALGDINNIQSQVIECLDNCQEQNYTGLPEKTINLIKIKHFAVIQ